MLTLCIHVIDHIVYHHNWMYSPGARRASMIFVNVTCSAVILTPSPMLVRTSGHTLSSPSREIPFICTYACMYVCTCMYECMYVCM